MARILVIDDEESIRELLCTVLTRKHHEVLLADGGQKGLELFMKRRPQVTILDLHMPGLDGIEVLRKIHSTDKGAKLVILTGYKSDDAEALARSLGVTYFLQKGFSLHELGAAIKETTVEKTIDQERHQYSSIPQDDSPQLSRLP
jgi:two-component system, NtrC family, response regulator AtoC